MSRASLYSVVSVKYSIGVSFLEIQSHRLVLNLELEMIDAEYP